MGTIKINPKKIVEFYRINGGKLILLSVGVLLVVSLIYFFYSYLGEKGVSVRDVRITNVTGTSATVTWITDEPARGSVIYSKEDRWFPLLNYLGKKRAYDDRDVEEVSYGNYAFKGWGKYYVHHVTLRDLEPKSSYYFKISSGYKTVDSKTYIPIIETAGIQNVVSDPYPAYGVVMLDSGEINNDVIVIARLVGYSNNGIEPRSQLLSTYTNDSGGFSIDINNVQLEDFSGNFDTNKSFSLVLDVYSRFGWRLDSRFDKDNLQPINDIVIYTGEEESEDKTLNKRDRFLSSLIGSVYAGDECAGLRGRHCNQDSCSSWLCRDVGGGNYVWGDEKVCDSMCSGMGCWASRCSGGSGGGGGQQQGESCSGVVDGDLSGYSCQGGVLRNSSGNTVTYWCGTGCPVTIERNSSCCRNHNDVCSCGGGGSGGSSGEGGDGSYHNDYCGPGYYCVDNHFYNCNASKENYTGSLSTDCVEDATCSSCQVMGHCKNDLCTRRASESGGGSGSGGSGSVGGGMEALPQCGQADTRAGCLYNFPLTGCGKREGELCSWKNGWNDCAYGYTCSWIGASDYYYTCVKDRSTGCWGGEGLNQCSGGCTIADLTGVYECLLIRDENQEGYLTEDAGSYMCFHRKRVSSFDYSCPSDKPYCYCKHRFNCGTEGLAGHQWEAECNQLCGNQPQSVANTCTRSSLLNAAGANESWIMDNDKDIYDIYDRSEVVVTLVNIATDNAKKCTCNEGYSWDCNDYVLQMCPAEGNIDLDEAEHGCNATFNLNQSLSPLEYQTVTVNSGSDTYQATFMCDLYGNWVLQGYCREVPSGGGSSSSGDIGITGSTATQVLGIVSSEEDSYIETEPGEYFVISDKYAITTGKVETFDGKIKVFLDTNGNGVKDEDEEYINWYDENAITLKKVKSTIIYDLKQGWQAISFPAYSEEVKTAKQLLDKINLMGGYATHVAMYAGGKWEIYTQRGNISFSNDFSLLPGVGYFVRVHGPVKLKFQGREYEGNVAVMLDKGWNLVGITSEKSYTAASLLEAMMSSKIGADTVTRWDNGRYDSYIYDNGVAFGNDFKIWDTGGYFVRVREGEGVFVP